MSNKDKAKEKILKIEQQEELFKNILRTKKYKEENYIEEMINFLNAHDNKKAEELNRNFNFSQSRSVFKKLNNSDKDLYISFYKKIYQETSLIKTEPKALENIFEFRMFWKKDINTFSSKTKNKDKQFRELVQFLFSNYKMPNFSFNVWKDLTRTRHDLAWFLHVADGQNLKKADFLPFKITNKQISNMFTAPDDYSFTQAMIWGLMDSLGVKNKMIKEEICSHNLTRHGYNMDFWSTVFVFINNMGFLEKSKIRPLLDYIHDQKFTINAAHPNFSMKNRNPATLLNEMESWHQAQRRLARIQERDRQKYNTKDIPKTWEPSFAPWEKLNANGKPLNPRWTITELTSLQDLSYEGSDLHHCVRSYHSRCALGAISILSLKRNEKSVITLEVDRKYKELNQARGFGNRKMTSLEQSIVEDWASSANIHLRRIL